MVYSRSVYEPDPEPTMLPILSADVGTKLYPPQLALICADKEIPFHSALKFVVKP